jgi:RNA polymerase sigma factor (sigma-70 family)
MSTDASFGGDAFADAQARLIRGDDRLLTELHKFLDRRGMELRKRYPLTADDVDDVVATALSRIWIGRSTFDPAKGTLAQWAYVILRRSAIDFLRARRSHLPAGDLAHIPTPQREVRPEAGRTSTSLAALRLIIEALPAPDQAILRAFAANPGGHWAADVAGELRLSPAAIRVRRYRLTQAIKAELLRRGHGYLTSDELAHASR